MQFANLPFVQFEQKLSYCHRLQDGIGASVKVTEGDPKLNGWFFDKPYFNM